MNAWDHLPNAVHIDRILASVKSHPELWNKAWYRARDQVWYRARGQVWEQARDQVGVRARGQVWDQAWGQVRYGARGALLALVAYDDSAKYLKLPVDQLQMLYQLTDHPACILLQPAVLVFEKERELLQG
jgi:hypothetical protein